MVTFEDPDRFTDASESHSNLTSTDYLDELRDYVQKTATPLLPTSSTLAVNFLDIDLPARFVRTWMTSAS